MRARSVLPLILVLVGALLLTAPAAKLAAQEDVNPFADLGLPEIAVTITDDAFEGVPSELEAGRYVLAVTNQTEAAEGGEETAGAAFLQAPEGMTAAELVELLTATPEEATPVDDGALASPVTEEEGGEGPPPWYYETAMAGGPYAFQGETAYAVVDLTAGEWILWAEFPGAPQAPVAVVVSGEPPADSPTPTADLTIEMSDFAFSFSTPLAAGPQVIELVNVGDQPHFIFVGEVPAGTTVDDVLALLATFDPAASPEATPVGGLSFEQITEVFSTGDQSAGVTAWYATDFAAGTHVAVCFVTDPETGMPHAMLGMIEIVEVA